MSGSGPVRGIRHELHRRECRAVALAQAVPTGICPGGRVTAEGPLAQLVAHLHDAQGVTGSSPVRPTRKVQVRSLVRGQGGPMM